MRVALVAAIYWRECCDDLDAAASLRLSLGRSRIIGTRRCIGRSRIKAGLEGTNASIEINTANTLSLEPAMSLSFVTKAIQTTAADGTFEEQPVIDTSATASSFRSGSGAGIGVGLFEQLRQNQEEEEAAREEFQRSIMRGTLALDDDDAAHLQQIQAQKQAARSAQEQQTAEQLASFRAAQAERSLQRSGGGGGSGPVELESMPQNQTTTFMADSIPISTSLLPIESPFSNSLTTTAPTAKVISSNVVPVTIKRRKRRLVESIADTTIEPPESERLPSTNKRAKGQDTATATGTASAPGVNKDGGLSSLLSGYSSSSSSSDT
jgi:hypothetical protein